MTPHHFRAASSVGIKRNVERERVRERKTDATSWRNIARLSEIPRPFPFACLPQASPSPFLSPFFSPVLSFHFASSFPPYRRIMLLWAIVTLLNYICSQWGVIAIGLLTRGTPRTSCIDIFSRSVSIVTFHWPFMCRMASHVITCRVMCASLIYLRSFQMKYKSYF